MHKRMLGAERALPVAGGTNLFLITSKRADKEICSEDTVSSNIKTSHNQAMIEQISSMSMPSS